MFEDDIPAPKQGFRVFGVTPRVPPVVGEVIGYGMLVCSKCKTEKPVEDFTVDRHAIHRGGRSYWCRQCLWESHNAWKLKNGIMPRLPKPANPAMKGLKRCSNCFITKDFADFSFQPSSKDGRDYRCRNCRSTQDRTANQTAERKKYLQKIHFMRLYGITNEEYDQMLLQQNFACAICGLSTFESSKALSVDHCHTTRAVRGILCQPCNHMLVMAKDRPDVLRKAAVYLERNGK